MITLKDGRQDEENIQHEHLYQITSNTLFASSFIYLHPNLIAALSDPSQIPSDFPKKVISQLETGIKFIKADSKDISGLKMYTGILKIKIADSDLAVYISKIYRDATGKLLCVAEHIVSHKEVTDIAGYTYGAIEDREESLTCIIDKILEA